MSGPGVRSLRVPRPREGLFEVLMVLGNVIGFCLVGALAVSEHDAGAARGAASVPDHVPGDEGADQGWTT